MKFVLLTISCMWTLAGLAFAFQETPPPATTPAVGQPAAVDPLLLKPPKTREDVDPRLQLANERLAALQPTTQPATRPTDEAAAQLLDCRIALYQDWNGYLGQLQRIVALQDSLTTLASEQRIQELTEELKGLEGQTAQIAQQPPPVTATAETIAEVSARHKDFEAQLAALSELQMRRSTQLATGFKAQRQGLEAKLAELRQARADFQAAMDAAPTTAPADRELLDLRRRRLDVQIAQQELNLLALTLETEQTQLLHKQDDRRTELLTRYVAALRARLTALVDAKSRSDLEVIALRREQATQPHEQALLDLQHFRESVLVHYFRNKNLLNTLTSRFTANEFNQLADRVTTSKAFIDDTVGTEQAAGALDYRTGKEVLQLRSEARQERAEFEADLTGLRQKLRQSVARLHELQAARERTRERFQELAQRALTTAAQAGGTERTRIETEVTNLRNGLNQAMNATIAEADEVVDRLRTAANLVTEHLRRLINAEETLYRTALKRRESGVVGLEQAAIGSEIRQLLGAPRPAPGPTAPDAPSLTAAGIAPAARDARTELAAYLRDFRADLDDLGRVWPLGAVLLVAAGGAGWLLRWVARRRTERALTRLAAAATECDPETGRPTYQFSERTDVLFWQLAADLVIPVVVTLALWATASAADLSDRTLRPAGTLIASILAAYVLLRLVRRLFHRKQDRRVFPCNDLAARHYRRWGRTLLVFTIVLLPLCALLHVMDVAPGIRALLREAWKTGAVLITLGFLLRKQRVIGLITTAPGSWRHVALSVLYPIVFLAVLALLGLQISGYGILAEYLATGVLASVVVLGAISGVVEYISDLLDTYVRPASAGPAAGAGRRPRSPRRAPAGTTADNPDAADASDALLPPGGYATRLIKSLLRLAGLVVTIVLVLQIWGAGGYLERIPWQKSTLGALAIMAALLVDRVLLTALSALRIGGRIPTSTANMIRRWFRGLLTAIVLLLLFALAGAPVDKLWAPLSALLGLVAIGFVAAWSLLSNILATVIILLWRPFNIGEHIEVQPEGISGKVVDINFMYTLLKSEEGARTTVPNSLFIQKFVRRQKLTSAPKRSLAEQLTADKPVGE